MATETTSQRKQRLTLKDVAVALGVSRTSVSNAFNRPEQLSRELRERIISEARKLGYFGPDPAARAMRSRRLRDVAVVLPHDLRYALGDPLSMDFMRGIAQELDARSLNLQMIPKLGQTRQLEAAFQTTADALIVHAEIDPELAPQVLAARKPLVLVDSFLPGVRTVGNNDRAGARLAMQHALSTRPHLVFILHFPIARHARDLAMGPGDPPQSAYIVGERIAGYQRAARDVNFPLDAITWIEVLEREPESAREALARLRIGLTPGTRIAVVAMSDRMALAAQSLMCTWTEITLTSVIGFDDGPAAALGGLTTIRQNAYLKGRLAVEALLDQKAFPLLPLELVVRNT